MQHDLVARFDNRTGAVEEIGDDQFVEILGRVDGDRRCIGCVDGRHHGDHVDHEREGRSGRNGRTHFTFAVGEIGGDVELTSTAGLHAHQSLVPTGDDHALAECHDEGIAAVIAVETGAVGTEHAHVIDEHGIARRGGRTFADGDVGDHQFGGNRRGECDLGFLGIENGILDEGDLTHRVVGGGGRVGSGIVTTACGENESRDGESSERNA